MSLNLSKYYAFSSNRETWADYAKGIGIMLMFFSHVYYRNGLLLDLVFTFHVPLFFFLSGYFVGDLKTKPITFKQYLYKNLQHLLVPYAFFYLLALPFGFSVVYSQPELFHCNSYIEILGRLLVGMLLVKNGEGFICTNMPTWFIASLFICHMLFYFIRKFKNEDFGLFVLSVISVILFFFSRTLNIFDLWHYQASLLSFPLYCLGRLFKKYKVVDCLKSKHRVLLLLGSITFFLICFICCQINGEADTVLLKFGNNILFYYIGALSGIGGVACFSLLKFKSTILAFIGSNSLIILGCHASISRVIRGLFGIVLDNSVLDFSVMTSGIIVLVVTAIHIPIIILFKKYCPQLVGSKKTQSSL